VTMTVGQLICLDDAIRVVTLFGPGNTGLFSARCERDSVVGGHRVQSVRECVQQPQSVCRNNLCMQAITVDDVFKEVTRITILLRGLPEIICGMMSMPTHSSRQFRFAALGIILLTVAIRLPSLLLHWPID